MIRIASSLISLQVMASLAGAEDRVTRLEGLLARIRMADLRWL